MIIQPQHHPTQIALRKFMKRLRNIEYLNGEKFKVSFEIDDSRQRGNNHHPQWHLIVTETADGHVFCDAFGYTIEQAIESANLDDSCDFWGYLK